MAQQDEHTYTVLFLICPFLTSEMVKYGYELSKMIKKSKIKLYYFTIGGVSPKKFKSYKM